MNDTSHDDRTLTELDHTRVSRLVGSAGAAEGIAAAMRELLDTSDVVPSRSVPPTIVTMASRVLVEDLRDGMRSEMTLCYPRDADPALGRVSVLSPAGAALLGLRAGGVARWRTPAAQERSVRVVSILFQPEAEGDFLA